MQSWERGEITAALSKLDVLLVLNREIPKATANAAILTRVSTTKSVRNTTS